MKAFGCSQRSDVQAKTAALRFAAIDRKIGIAEYKTTNNVGSARNRLQGQFLNIAAHPVKVLRVKNGPCREDGAKPRKAEFFRWDKIKIAAQLEVGWACPEDRNRFLLYDTPKRFRSFYGPIEDHELHAGS